MAARGKRKTRTVMVPGSTGLEAVDQAVVEYGLEVIGRHELVAIHITGSPENVGELVLRTDGELTSTLFVDLNSTETTSKSDPEGELTLYTFKDAEDVLRRQALEADATEHETREAAFQARLTHLIGE